MRVAIVGAGIGGPTLAYWLRRLGHEAVLFEKAPAPRTGGYLIDFWGLGYDLAERMGILPALTERGYLMQRLRMVDANGREEAGMNVVPLRRQLRGRFISIARADLASAILRACDGVQTHYGVSVDAVTEDHDRVRIALTNGVRETVDLLVGADGLHSKVRELVFGPEERFETSLGCYVAAFRLRDYPRRDELTYVSHTIPKRHVSRVALHGGETLVLLVCRSEVLEGGPPRESPKAALRRAFGDMKWEVPALLEGMNDVDDLYFDRVSQVHLPHWYSGRTALLGDAAACASLLAGEGTGLAMIEAYVLAGELNRFSGDVPRALASYEARLRPTVKAKQKAAVRFRGFFAPRTAIGLAVRDLAVNTFALPFVGKRLVTRAVRDELALPDYEHGESMQELHLPA